MEIKLKSYLEKRSPLRAAHAQCLRCQGNDLDAIANCTGDGDICPLWLYRLGRKPPDWKARGREELLRVRALGKHYSVKPESYLKKWRPLLALRAYCARCVKDREKVDPVACRPLVHCPAWLYRYGRKQVNWQDEARQELARLHLPVATPVAVKPIAPAPEQLPEETPPRLVMRPSTTPRALPTPASSDGEDAVAISHLTEASTGQADPCEK